jgi:hypothetical protein
LSRIPWHWGDENMQGNEKGDGSIEEDIEVVEMR